jgi:hypothetical protein
MSEHAIPHEGAWKTGFGTDPPYPDVRVHGEYWRVSGPSLNIANLVL